MAVRSPLGSSSFFAVSSNGFTRERINFNLIQLKQEYPELLFSSQKKLKIEESTSFEELYACLKDVDSQLLMNMICLVDLTDTFPEGGFEWKINGEGKKSLFNAPELVLNFPEVYFIFVMPKGREGGVPNEHVLWSNDLISDSSNSFLLNLLPLVRNHICGFRNWFDGTGLRRSILENSSVIKKNSERNIAFSIDEEATYGLFNSYYAYMHGYDCNLINTKAQFDDTFNSDDQNKFENISKILILEDMDALFSDLTGQAKREFDYLPSRFSGCSVFSNLGDGCLVNKKSDIGNIHRVLITTCSKTLRQIRDESILNGRTEETLLSDTADWSVWPQAKVQKPHGGVYCFKLQEQLHRNGNVNTNIPQRLKLDREYSTQDNNNHSAPFVNQLIAENLKSRAARIFSPNASFEDSIQVALLAATGLVLLQGQTHTLVKECLALQFCAEVSAESQFPGINFNLVTKTRLQALDDLYIEHIFESMGNNESKTSISQLWQKSAFLLEVYNDLRAIYLASGRIEEEQEVLKKIRKEHGTLKKTESRKVKKADIKVEKTVFPMLMEKPKVRMIKSYFLNTINSVGDNITSFSREIVNSPRTYLYYLVNNGVATIFFWALVWCLGFSVGLLLFFGVYWYQNDPGVFNNINLFLLGYEVFEKVMTAFFIPDTPPLLQLVDCLFDGTTKGACALKVPENNSSVLVASLIKLLSFIVTITGVAHTGIFIAYIYQKISRK